MSDAPSFRVEHDRMGHVWVTEKCIQGVTADEENCRKYAEASAELIASLAPMIGYENAARLLQKFPREEKSIRQIICEDRFLSTEQLDELLNLPALATGKR
jgi:aspartate ammonia-lyase